MTKDEAIVELNNLINGDGDREVDHIRADEILCELLIGLGCDEVVKSFNEIGKWYA